MKKELKDNNKVGQLETLLKVFKENTDEKNPANLKHLGIVVAERLGKDKSIDARTVSSDINILKRLGFAIEKTTGGYYLEKRNLDRAEIKLLCDQITFSSIMPADRKDTIIKGLTSDLPVTDHDLIRSNISLQYKSPYVELLYKDTIGNTNKIIEAIKENKKISFNYGDYNEKKELITKKKIYKVSPYEFVYEQGKYYIMCQNEDEDKIRNYRIDLMTNIKMINSKRDECPIDENLTDYCLKQLNMYSTDNEDITLELDGLGLRGLYDKLGLDSNVSVRKLSDDKYEAKFVASHLGTKYFVLQYSEHLKVLKPVKLKNEVVKSLKESLEKYN